VVQWEGRYSTVMGQLTGENCRLLSILVEKGNSLIVQVTVLLMNEDFDPPKTTKDFTSVSLQRKHSTKLQTVGKIQYKQVAKLWSNGHV
jgi:hypothetical protein